MQGSLNAVDRMVNITAQGRDYAIECRLLSPEKTDKDLIVFLHEGLGSVALWRDWPEQLCALANCRGLVFSRYGYGQSTPRPADEKWPVSYMHTQAEHFLPAVLAALGLDNEKPVFYGHSDGGSIALLYAAMYPERTKAIAVAAPHIFVEDITIASIEKAREAYLHTDLPQKFARYHQNPDLTFWAWNDIWLNPEFKFWNIEKYLPDIRCPVLAIQGKDDEYGTLDQIQGIHRVVSNTKLCIIDDCRHSPHKDQPEQLNAALINFITNLNPIQADNK
ncbi:MULTISPECIES: alpha/beta fold hydrolase [unclassified Pusillimonas]|uniref:alpha/beta fold hydrolase n=1 Tax=unclassified Pusillimonas TaxID=2640016 RepID=UPI000B9D3DD9|nr:MULTISPECIES: alpha/beta hydrolase [unclassified Pusillimonas]OXR50598.1 alpha/beta hydrolase [Pusillimonas sp. T2]ROT45480.1 alpha/beta hydrolase [Pusillimonas sp. NJUB218]